MFVSNTIYQHHTIPITKHFPTKISNKKRTQHRSFTICLIEARFCLIEAMRKELSYGQMDYT